MYKRQEYDNDPLDVIILGTEKFLPGVLVPCRVVGILNVDDSGERDDKILAVPLGDPDQKAIQDLSHLDPKMMERIEYFLEHYKDLEKKSVKITGKNDAQSAITFIEECITCYQKKFS